MPATTINGKTTVDFDAYNHLEVVNQKIKQGMTAGQIQSIIAQFPELEYDTTSGEVKFRQSCMKPFMVMSGIVSDDVWKDANLKNSK